MMSSTASLQGVSSNLLSSTTNTTAQIIEPLSSIGDSFSELFAKSQDVNTIQESVLSLTTDNVTDNLNTMQDELLSNLLGYNSGINALASATDQVTDVATTFSLDTLKESFQSNLLNALQANTVISNSVEQVTITETSMLDDAVNFAFNDDGIGLEDAFDVVNIAQHIPIVSSLYEATTEQESISSAAQLAGDFLYGGPIGLVYSLADMAIESYTGTSVGDAITQFDYSGFLFGEESSAASITGDLTSDTTETSSEDETLFFDKYKNVLFSRD